MADQEEDQGIAALHSSPHDFDEFDISKIGTGEGNQSYGHGLYFSENPKVSGQGGQYWNQFWNKMKSGPERSAASALWANKFDRDKAIAHLDREHAYYLDQATPKKYAYGPDIEEGHRILAEEAKAAADHLRSGKIAGPRTYEVSINAHPDHFLDWDKPLSEQHELLQQKIYDNMLDNNFEKSIVNHILNNKTGQDLYNELVGRLSARNPSPESGAEKASNFLKTAGIKGIKYLDAGSRGNTEKPTRNYVVFDDKLVNVKRRYARGGEVEREGLAGGGSPDNDMIRDALSRVASPFSDNPELAAKAVEIANQAYKVPTGNITAGPSYYGFKGPMDVSDIQTTVEPLPDVSPAEKNPMSWEDFYNVGKGGTMINLGGDRSRLGRLTHINGKQLAWPVDLHAGPEYMLEPNPGAVWANAPGHTSGLRNKILQAAEKGPVYGVYTPMGPKTVDSSFQMFDALLSQIAADPPSKKVAKQLDDALKQAKFVMGSTDKAVKDREKEKDRMENWPGILNALEAREHAKTLPGSTRSLIVKYLDRASWHKLGLPHIGMTRAAITSPDLLGAPANMMGHRIVELSPEDVEETAFKHNTYKSPTGGKYVGDVPLVQRQYAMPDVMDQFLARRVGSKGDVIMHPYSLQSGGRDAARKMLEEQKQMQPVSQRMLDSIQQGLERQSKYGLKDGGEVDREGLAGGGNPGDIAGGGYGDGNIGGGTPSGDGSDSPTTGGDQYGGDQYGGNDNYSGSGGRDNYTSYGDGGPDLSIGGPQGLTGAAAFGRPELGTDTYNLDNAPPTTVGAKLAASPNIGADLVKEAVTPDLGTANSPFASGAQSYDQTALDAINERIKTDQQVLRDAAVQRTIGDRPSTIGIPNAPTSAANMYNMAGAPTTEGSYADAQSIYNQRLYNSVFGPEKETGAQISVPNAGDLYGATNAPLAIQQTPVSAPSPTANQSLEEYMGTVPPADMQQMITKQLQKTNQFNVNVKDFLDATGSPLSYATTYGMALPKLAEKNINFQPGQKIDPATGLPATGIATFTGNMNAKLTPEQQAAKDEFDKQFGKTFTPITKTTYGVEERGPMMGGDLTGPSMTFDSFSQMAPQEQTEAQTPVVASDVMRGTMGITPPAPAEPRVGMPQLAQQPIQIPQSQTQAQTNPSVPSYSSSLQPQQTIRQNFEQAFADARASGAQTFYWTNPKTGVTSLYGTKIARKEGGRVPSFNEPDEWLAEKNESKKNAVKKANKRMPKPERSPIVGRALMLSSSKS